MSQIEIGRLLRASTSGLVVGCRVSQVDAPAFGALVRVPVDPAYQIYGLIYDIHIDDDGLVRQLITAEGVNEDVIADNRLNRNVPLEMSVLSIGYRLREQYFHAIPPRPPLSLDSIYLCDAADVSGIHLRRSFWLLPPHPALPGPARRRAAGSPSPASG